MMGFCGEGIPSKALVKSEFCNYPLCVLHMGREVRPGEHLLRGVVGYVLRLERRWDP